MTNAIILIVSGLFVGVAYYTRSGNDYNKP